MNYIDELYELGIDIPNVTNKNSNTLKESYHKKRYLSFYNYVLSHTPNDMIFKERLYWIFNNIHSRPVCKYCGKKVKFVSFGEGYKKFCSGPCASRDEQTKQEVKERNLKKYGVDNPAKLQSSIDKARQTYIDHYGDPNYRNLEKSQQTKLERYGDPKYTNRKKANRTNLERYGSEKLFASKIIQDKIKQTKLERYGDPFYANPEKSQQTKLERYGNPFYANSEKSQQTKLERYGDPFYTNPEKIQQTKLERYGDPFYTNLEKSQQTKLERYGNQFYVNPEKIRENFKKTIQRRNQDILGYTSTGDRIMKCPHVDCNKCVEKEYIIPGALYYNRHINNTETCTKLLPIDDYKSKNTSIEIFIKQLLDKYNIQYISNSRNIISPKEIDIYIPEKKIAIECNGIYWHSDQNKPQKYHYDKYKECQEKGIQLISVWEDQIINNPDIIISIILSKLGIYDKRVYARKCKIIEVSSKECNEFLDRYHLQGKANSSIKLGLYYNDELISVMTFGKGRKCLNSKANYELYRYCCKEGVQVIGGATKLLKYFIKKYKPESIESFSSNDISNGDLYKHLEFEYVSESQSYWYVDKEMNRYHRYKFTKYSLIKEGFDPDKTEFEIMDERGFYRIYDSGQSKWILKIGNQ